MGVVTRLERRETPIQASAKRTVHDSLSATDYLIQLKVNVKRTILFLSLLREKERENHVKFSKSHAGYASSLDKTRTSRFLMFSGCLINYSWTNFICITKTYEAPGALKIVPCDYPILLGYGWGYICHVAGYFWGTASVRVGGEGEYDFLRGSVWVKWLIVESHGK